MMQLKHVCYITTAFRWFYTACQNLIIFCTNEKQFIFSVVQSCIVTPLQVLIFIQVLIYCLVKLVVTHYDIRIFLGLGYFYTISDFTRTHAFESTFLGQEKVIVCADAPGSTPPPPPKHLTFKVLVDAILNLDCFDSIFQV